jgi:DNA-binding NarL/FixJ family response regulator
MNVKADRATKLSPIRPLSHQPTAPSGTLARDMCNRSTAGRPKHVMADRASNAPPSAGDRVTRVLLVDDRPLIRAGLRAMLHEHWGLTVVGEATDCAQAVKQACDLQPDVIIIDTLACAIDAIEVTRRLSSECRQSTPRILLLGNAPSDSLYEAMQAGASGLLLTYADPRDLIATVQMVAAGYILAPSCLPREVVQGLLHQKTLGPAPQELQTLTQRERDVLTLVAQGSTNGEIATILCLSESTVKSHMQHLLAKLGLRNRVEVAIYAYEVGLVQVGSAPLPQRQEL